MATRSRKTAFDAAREQVVAAVRDVLSRKPYRDTWEESNGSHFATVIDQTWWGVAWWVGIPMSVEIGETEGRVFVRARIKPVWFISDAPDVQYRLMLEFSEAVKKQLAQARSGRP